MPSAGKIHDDKKLYNCPKFRAIIVFISYNKKKIDTFDPILTNNDGTKYEKDPPNFINCDNYDPFANFT